MYDHIIWIGMVFFVTLISMTVILYFQSERFDEKYKKKIEVIRAIKTQKFREVALKFQEEEKPASEKEDAKKDFPSEGDFRELEKKILKSNQDLNRLMKKAADLKMWFDYLPRAKEFLTTAALWVFLLSISVLAFFLSIWAELDSLGHIRYAGYLSFIWIFMSIRLFKNLLRYNMVTKNIDKHMDMLRDGEVEKF